MTYKITSLAGDGIGPEIMTSGLQVLEAVAKKYNHTFEIESHPFGGAGIDVAQDPIPSSTLKACRDADAILLGAIAVQNGIMRRNVPKMAYLHFEKRLVFSPTFDLSKSQAPSRTFLL